MRNFTHNIELNKNKLVESQPGNGTRYTLIFTQLDDQTCEHLGAQKGSWLVSRLNSMNNRTWPFAPYGPLTYDYVMEKLHCNEIDASEVTKLIGKILNRPIRVTTDEFGKKLESSHFIDLPEPAPAPDLE